MESVTSFLCCIMHILRSCMHEQCYTCNSRSPYMHCSPCCTIYTIMCRPASSIALCMQYNTSPYLLYRTPVLCLKKAYKGECIYSVTDPRLCTTYLNIMTCCCTCYIELNRFGIIDRHPCSRLNIL